MTNEPITPEVLALLLDANSDMGQWNGGDVCDAVAALAAPAMRECPKCHLVQSSSRDNCIGCPAEFEPQFRLIITVDLVIQADEDGKLYLAEYHALDDTVYRIDPGTDMGQEPEEGEQDAADAFASQAFDFYLQANLDDAFPKVQPEPEQLPSVPDDLHCTCGGDLQICENGYVRMWSLRRSRRGADVIVADSGDRGLDVDIESGDGNYWVECKTCLKRYDDSTVEWEWN
jgi:hypothetical protein